MRVVAVTACPQGIAYTYIAAEALRRAAYDLGIDLIIESQAALGVEGALTAEEIKNADGVIIACDQPIDLERFKDKRIVVGSTADAIKDAAALFNQVIKNEN